MSALGKMSGDGPEQEDSKQGGTQKCAERRGSGFLMEGNILAAQKMFAPKKPWKSSAARIPAASLTHPLHPMETLGRGMGTEIAVDPSTTEVLQDRHLARKTLALVNDLQARPLPEDPFLAELRREMEAEQAAKEMWEDSDPDDDEGGVQGGKGQAGRKKVKNITDLKPSEMARLEHRFKDEGGASGGGLTRDTFEAAMREFTGMEV
jgi:hypothetical protein